MHKEGVPTLQTSKWATWLIGIAALAICVAVTMPFLLSLAGYGLPYRAAGTHGTPFTLSDAVLLGATIVGFWCVGWIVSKQIGRRIDREGRLLSGWARFLIMVAAYAVVVLSCLLIPLRESYASAVSVGCAIMVMNMVGTALRKGAHGIR